MKKLLERLAISLFLAVVVYAGVSFFADLEKLWQVLSRFPMDVFIWACLLACGNYLFRFLKWQFYLNCLNIDIAWTRSLGIFLSGFVMSVTPGKIGEVFKAYLMKCSNSVPMTKTTSVVVAERVTDLMAILLLSLVGVFTFSSARILVLVGGVFVIGFIFIISSEKLCLGMLRMISRLPRLGSVAEKMEEFYKSMGELLKPWPLFVGGLLSVFGWSLEAVAFFFILRAFPLVEAEILTAFMIYSFSTAAGALSFLPGGLGVTEGGMIALLIETVKGATKTISVAATLLIRLATLWFAVLLGFISLGWMRLVVGPSFWRMNPMGMEKEIKRNNE